jgi:rhamnose transport system permease protein
VYGAALGALLLACIGSALAVLRVNGFWEQAIVGALLLTAITIDRLLALRVTHLLQRRSARRAG